MLEYNSLYCGDCLELSKEIDDNSVNLIFTSPPYSDIKKYHRIGEESFNGISSDVYCDWFVERTKQFYRMLKDDGSFILNINDKVENGFRSLYVFELVIRICNETGFQLYERLFWNKMKGLPNSKRFGDRVEYIFWFVKQKNFVFNIDEMRVPYSNVSKNRMKNPIKKRFSRTIENQDEDTYKEWSPNENGAMPTTLVSISSEVKRVSNQNIAVFPVSLPLYFIKGATNENDLVLDPFSGAASTAVACKQSKRNFIGFDISEAQTKEAKERLQRC